MPHPPARLTAALSEGSPREAADPVANTATQVFNERCEPLFSIDHDMLGSIADTEDVPQETRLSWTTRNQAPSPERIDSPRVYLVRMAVNRALAGGPPSAIAVTPQGAAAG